MSNGERIHIDLTDEQQSHIKRASGKDIVALEFAAEELEQRIVPTTAPSISEITVMKPTHASSAKLF